MCLGEGKKARLISGRIFRLAQKPKNSIRQLALNYAITPFAPFLKQQKTAKLHFDETFQKPHGLYYLLLLTPIIHNPRDINKMTRNSGV